MAKTAMMADAKSASITAYRYGHHFSRSRPRRINARVNPRDNQSNGAFISVSRPRNRSSGPKACQVSKCDRNAAPAKHTTIMISANVHRKAPCHPRSLNLSCATATATAKAKAKAKAKAPTTAPAKAKAKAKAKATTPGAATTATPTATETATATAPEKAKPKTKLKVKARMPQAERRHPLACTP